jgi:hypothetical protein
MRKWLLQDSFKKYFMKKKLVLLVIMSVFSIGCYAQNEQLYITDKISDKYAYIDVTKTYERVAAKGYKSIDLFQKLGNSFYKSLDMEKAAKWYGELFALTSDLEPEYYKRYAQSLTSIGQIINANEVLEKLKQKTALMTKQNSQKQ